jgi:CheY-like chemotaxis protein
MARILLVDDDEDLRDIMKDVLKSGGHEFVLASSGPEAIKILETTDVDLAITDRNMPGMSGIEVIRHIRLDPRTAGLKVLMCTSSSFPQEIDEAFAAGADGYVFKPHTPRSA